jgi:GLPGLI family protein
MKKIPLLILIINICYSQQKIDIVGEARYELTFKEYKNQQPVSKKNTFIMVFNNNESFFKNMSIYVKDSLVDCNKIRETGDEQKDFSKFAKYVPELPYTIYKKENQIIFSNEIPFAGELKYTENIDFNWKICKDIKIINGLKCIKATTTKWGRNWIAYYSPNHPVPFGPYKFYGLPGLIFEITDDKNDYTFTLYKYKKRIQNNFLTHNYYKAKKVTRKQYENIRHNAALKPSDVIVEGYPDINKKINKIKIEKEKNYNPIELTD